MLLQAKFISEQVINIQPTEVCFKPVLHIIYITYKDRNIILQIKADIFNKGEHRSKKAIPTHFTVCR